MRKNFGAKAFSYPQPVFIIATYNEDGSADAMNAAWGGISDTTELSVCLSEGHKTVKNLLRTGAFTVSMGDAKHVAACDYVGIVSGNNTPDKMEKSGLTAEKSAVVDAPLFTQLPLTLECKYVHSTEEGNIIGEIVNISADERILGADGKIDMTKFRPISYEPVHNGYHVLGERVGTAFSDGMKLK